MAGIVWNLLRAGNAPEDLCVLTPYAAQRAALRRRLRWEVQQSLVVDCVDQFQGQERKIVVLSLVCSNTRGSIGLLSHKCRLNVALTRAQTGMVVVGNGICLYAADREGFWRSFLSQYVAMGCVTNGMLESLPAKVMNFKMDCSSSPADAAPKTQTTKQYSWHRFQKLPAVYIDMLVTEFKDCMTQLLSLSAYICWLDWVLRLPEHHYRGEDLPDDPRLWDQKGWSHLLEFFRTGLRRDAGNAIYSYCIVAMAHSVAGIPKHWERLTQCKILAGDGMVQNDLELSDKKMERIGDIFEARGGLFAQVVCKEKVYTLVSQSSL